MVTPVIWCVCRGDVTVVWGPKCGNRTDSPVCVCVLLCWFETRPVPAPSHGSRDGSEMLPRNSNTGTGNLTSNSQIRGLYWFWSNPVSFICHIIQHKQLVFNIFLFWASIFNKNQHLLPSNSCSQASTCSLQLSVSLNLPTYRSVVIIATLILIIGHQCPCEGAHDGEIKARIWSGI